MESYVVVLALSLVALSLGSTPPAPGDSGEPVVRTPNGALRGTTMTSRSGRNIFAFRGVRYALPPTGELRFKAPVSVTDKWSGIRNATGDAASCPQGNNFLDGPVSEDCLFLNVFTTKIPKQETNSQHPVIVWFHPGGWFVGSGQSNLAGPHYLLDEEIVFVSINHRLGALGFLSTGDAEAPGNYALKDQVAALQWIHDNVAYFGGDPNSITLYGGSSGGASVQYHMLSPLSTGLFHRVISSSGSCLSGWAFNKDPMATAKKQAETLNCPHDERATSKDIVDCLRGKDAMEISKSYSNLWEWNKEPFVVFAPVIETDDSSNHAFLTADPALILQSGNFTHVPLLTGSTDNEMIDRAYEILNNVTLLDYLNENFERIVPYAFFFEKATPGSRQKSKKIKEFYFGNSAIIKDSLQKTSDMFTDSYFLYGADQLTKMVSRVSKEPVYYFLFSYPGYNGTTSEVSGMEKTSAPTAINDLSYLLYSSRLFPFFGKDHPEIHFSQVMVKMWTNFAKTGNPTPEPQEIDPMPVPAWLPHTPDDLFYMDLGSELKMKRALRQERAALWERVYLNTNPH